MLKNKGCLGIGAVVLVIGFLAFMYGISIYNAIAKQEQSVERQWAQVEDAYQSRMDKTTNLLAIVEKAANFEKETLQNVIEARAKASSIQINADDLTPENIEKFQQAQDQFGSALSRLLAVAESYPDLQAVQAYRDFQTQYEGMENRISVERKRFNLEVETFNKKIVTFPNSALAGIFGFSKKGYFKAAEGADVAPDIRNM